jgi:FkbM family methyltransferase
LQPDAELWKLFSSEFEEIPDFMLFRELTRILFASALHRLRTVKYGHRIADSRLGKLIAAQGAVLATLRCGAQALCFANDYIGRSMYLWGDYNPRISALVASILRPGDTALDIGANFGVVGLPIANIVGPTGRVHLFEPQPVAAQCLRASLFINGYSQAALHECALSDHSGSAMMTIVDPANLGETTLELPGPRPALSAGQIEVKLEEAGRYIEALGLKKVALIKIDVEGHEPVILESLREWLTKVRVPVILFECHVGEGRFLQMPTVRILSSLGYEFLSYDLKPAWRTRLIPVRGTTNPVGYDFVAVLRQELDEDRRNALQSFIE